MDSLRSIHARVAALSRFRAPDDPELAACRDELARCKEQTSVIRARIGSVPPAACTAFLDRTAARV